MLLLRRAGRRALPAQGLPRRSLAASASPGAAAIKRVGIVGAGPSAFYAAKFLLKELGPGATVELIDRCVAHEIVVSRI